MGSTYGIVASWSDAQITATVAAISTSGTVQVDQGGLLSNAVPLDVTTATITSITPTSGVAGTLVTIDGSGFGAAQGSGLVLLGSAYGVVQSWGGGEVTALVASGSVTGQAQILQGGVWSNSIPFAVNSLNILSVTPNSGEAGTSIEISGTGFGSTQGSGTVWLGSENGQVLSWGDTNIVATVATSSLSGVARVQQNGVWSNALTFTVPASGGNALTLIPNVMNLVAGETQTIQALDANSQPVTGLTWSSSDPTIVSLSTDDPPILSAIAPGRVTITAGTASSDVTVFAILYLPVP